ncbi:substrate-binding domain-containing protein [Anaerolentibacter hominis]|uniref:substrate-binding domain-containing protein n=1 Tax=Anaerolentibacter hominis TaxID=3079009 RepID=UPI0031B8B156
MKKMKKVLSLLMAAVMMLTLTACGSKTKTTDGPAAADRSDETYVYVTFEKGSEYFSWVYAGFLDAAKELGVKAELQGPADADASQEARILETVTGKHPNGILVACADEDTMVSSINNALEEGIPVITCDSDCPGSDRLCYLGTDNASFGATAAEFIGGKMGGQGEVIIVTLFGSVAQEERCAGFEDYLAENYPGITIVDKCNEAGDTATAESNTTAALQANPNVKAVFSTGGTGSAGAAAAVRTVRKDDITVVGSDFGTATLECMEKGEIAATVVDDPYMMGYQSMLQLFAAAHPTDVLSSTAPYGHISTSDILFNCSLLKAEDYIGNEQLREKYTSIPTFN